MDDKVVASELSNSPGRNGGNDNGGSASGGEKFEAAVERPIVVGPVNGVSIADSSELSMPNIVLPTESVSANVDDDDEVGVKVRVLKEESFGGWGGAEALQGNEGEALIDGFEGGGVGSGEKNDLNWKGIESLGGFEGGKRLEEEKNGEGATLTEELVGDKVVGVDAVKFTGGGDSVNIVHDLAVGDTGEIKKSEIKGIGGDLDNGFDQSGSHENEKADSDYAGDRNVDNFARGNIETIMVETSEPNIDIDAEEKGNSDSTNLIVNGVTEDKLNGERFESTDMIINKQPLTGIDVDELKVEASVSLKELSDEKVDVTQTVNRDTESTQSTAPPELVNLDNDSQGRGFVDRVLDESVPPESAESSKVSKTEIDSESGDAEGEIEGSISDGEADDSIFGSSEAAKKFLEELEQRSSAASLSVADSNNDHSQRIDGQIVTDSDEEVDTDDEGEGKELVDNAALAALLRAATGADSDGGGITITSRDGSRLFSVERPAGLGSTLPNMKPAARSTRPNLFTPPIPMAGRDSEVNLSEEEKNKLEKLQQIRVKFLRLVQRLGHSLEDPIVAQVLYRLALVAGKPNSQIFSLDSAKNTALQLEAEGKDDLKFSLNILVLGKTGVGKSATINSIFGEEKASIHAFEPATTAVKEVTGIVDGVQITVIDTPGLKSSAMEQRDNRWALASIKKFKKACPPDIVLYVDRLDTRTRDLNDLPLLRSITSSLGSSIWRNAIVTLTHAASAPPDGPSGSPLSYEVFVGQRSHVVQQSIGHAVGDLRLMNPGLMNPVSLVENHPSCRKNRDGHKVLPNGQSWKPQLLLLCYSMKILSEASSLSKPQEPTDHRKLFGFRVRSPPLPYLLSWLLQSRTHPKLSSDQGGDNGDSDIDMADFSDSDQEEEEDEYEQLPPFRPLNKAQLAKLSKEQRKAYLEEYDYRVKLLQKKQWREEIRRMKEMKKKGKPAVGEYGDLGGAVDEEDGGPASVPVPLPDMVLPPSFDGDNPAYRYRFLEPTSQFMARPVLDTHGWDHDCGYDGVNLEHSLAIVNWFPAAIALQLTKDKKEFNIHLDSSVSAKHGENGSTMAGFDIQNVGKQLAYILRGETKFKNFRKNKTAAGFSITFLGENVATGLKLEDQIAVGKRLMLVGSTGTVRSQGDSAYGVNLEVRLRDADFPVGQDQSSLGLSLVKWRGDLALGANLQSQFSLGRGSKVAIRAGLNNKMSGQITVRTSSSDQLQIALVALLPIAKAIYKTIRPGVSDKYSIY